jgi:tetratricopeptide (TPR) repeat protein
MYLFQREYAKAESCYQQIASHSEKAWRSWGRECLAYIPLYQGKFDQALKVLDDCIAAERMEQVEGWGKARKHAFKADIYDQAKNFEMALKEVRLAIEIVENSFPDELVSWRPSYVEILARSGNIAKAEEVAQALKRAIEEKDQTQMHSYWHAAGCLEFSRGNLEAALANFEKASETSTAFWDRFMLAKTYLELGKLGDAVAELEKALSRYDYIRVGQTISAVKVYYLLGLAYEKSGWNEKAIEQYEEFLEIWKDADPGIPEVEDAKERLAKLKATS